MGEIKVQVTLDESFEELIREHNNSVDNLLKWIQDSKLIDESKEAEEKARKLFADVRDESNVELEKFREAIAKLAEENKKAVGELTKLLSEQGPKLVSAIMAGASAFKEAFEKK